MMSIVDREVIGEGCSDGYTIPELSLGNFVENIFRKNIENKGDGSWLVIARLIFNFTLQKDKFH